MVMDQVSDGVSVPFDVPHLLRGKLLGSKKKTQQQKTRKFENTHWQYAISQLPNVHSGLHLVTYLDVGNFCDKSTETN